MPNPVVRISPDHLEGARALTANQLDEAKSLFKAHVSTSSEPTPAELIALAQLFRDNYHSMASTERR